VHLAAGAGPLERVERPHLLADHGGDERGLIDLGGHELALEGAVAQHGHPVADRVDLSRKCETNRIATPSSRSARITVNRFSTSLASRLEVGSSRISTLESVTVAR